MSRTTIDIDAPVLKDLKRRQKMEHKSMGRLVSQLLAESLQHYKTSRPAPPVFRWLSRPMGARVILADKEAIFAAMDESPKQHSRRGRKS